MEHFSGDHVFFQGNEVGVAGGQGRASEVDFGAHELHSFGAGLGRGGGVLAAVNGLGVGGGSEEGDACGEGKRLEEAEGCGHGGMGSMGRQSTGFF